MSKEMRRGNARGSSTTAKYITKYPSGKYRKSEAACKRVAEQQNAQTQTGEEYYEYQEIDIDDIDICGAVRDRNEAMVKTLLEIGKVGIDLRDNYHRTPLSYAVVEGHEAVVKLLLDTGGMDVESNDIETGRMLLSLTAESGHEAVVGLLLDTNKVKVDLEDNTDQTPLSYAASKGHAAVVKLRLGAGKFDVNSRDKKDRTPLSYAILGMHEAVVKLLLDIGETDMDPKGMRASPILMAALAGNTVIFKMLLIPRWTMRKPRYTENLGRHYWSLQIAGARRL
jgi:ankyrin repeat protein